MATGDTSPHLGLADVLHAVESWPPDRVLALSRELAASLPPEGRAFVVRELLRTDAVTGPRPRVSMSEIRGSLPLPEGWPETIDAEGLGERRLRGRYGS